MNNAVSAVPIREATIIHKALTVVRPAFRLNFHDGIHSQRHNDHRDPLHGQRAADFAVGLRRERIPVETGPSEFEHLCEAMRLHSDGHVEGEPASDAPSARQVAWPRGGRGDHEF